MEIVNLNDMREFQSAKVIKKIPMLSSQLMSTILYISPNTATPSHKHAEYDEIHYVIQGLGEITIDNESNKINEGMMILVPHSKSHSLTTTDEQLMVLTINQVPIEKMLRKENVN